MRHEEITFFFEVFVFNFFSTFLSFEWKANCASECLVGGNDRCVLMGDRSARRDRQSIGIVDHDSWEVVISGIAGPSRD